MSVQCCPLSGADYCGPECSTTVMRRARKSHWCCECHEEIQPGDRYEYCSGIWDGEPRSYKTCASCVEIRDHFQCEGWLFEQVWQDIEDNFFPTMRAGGPCMDGLSPAAKNRLFERYNAWKADLTHPKRKWSFNDEGFESHDFGDVHNELKRRP